MPGVVVVVVVVGIGSAAASQQVNFPMILIFKKKYLAKQESYRLFLINKVLSNHE